MMTIEQIDAAARAGVNILALKGDPSTAPLADFLLPQLDARLKVEAKKIELEQATSKNRMAIEGPALWAKWHSRALQGDPTDEAAERNWVITEIAAKLPCGDCKAHFLSLFRALFAHGFTSYFTKTVEAHNAVNRRIEKPLFTTDAARKLWEAASAQPAA